MGTRDHAGLLIMGSDTCHELLLTTPIGRVAFVKDGEVNVLPVNYRWHKESVVFRSAVGAKLDVASMHQRVAFEIDGWDADAATGWSVLVSGVAEEVESEDELSELNRLGLRPWAGPKNRNRWVRIVPETISGRTIV